MGKNLHMTFLLITLIDNEQLYGIMHVLIFITKFIYIFAQTF
jgi:hypothetical protein